MDRSEVPLGSEHRVNEQWSGAQRVRSPVPRSRPSKSTPQTALLVNRARALYVFLLALLLVGQLLNNSPVEGSELEIGVFANSSKVAVIFSEPQISTAIQITCLSDQWHVHEEGAQIGYCVLSITFPEAVSPGLRWQIIAAQGLVLEGEGVEAFPDPKGDVPLVAEARNEGAIRVYPFFSDQYVAEGSPMTALSGSVGDGSSHSGNLDLDMFAPLVPAVDVGAQQVLCALLIRRPLFIRQGADLLWVGPKMGVPATDWRDLPLTYVDLRDNAEFFAPIEVDYRFNAPAMGPGGADCRREARSSRLILSLFGMIRTGSSIFIRPSQLIQLFATPAISLIACRTAFSLMAHWWVSQEHASLS